MDYLVDFVEYSVANITKSAHYESENEHVSYLRSMQIEKLYGLTTFIDLDKLDTVSHNRSQSKDHLLRLFIDKVVLNELVRENVINNSSNLAKLYPLRTAGDGNCLVIFIVSI